MRLLLLRTLAACTAEKPEGDDSGKPPVQPMDADSDGYDASVDCDDAHATVNPDAPELCDGVDNNCSGAVDEGVLNTYYLDQDGDGYGVEAVEGCSAPASAVELDGDCDDDAPATYPEAPEVCDGTDNNCNDEVDEEAEDAALWYSDADGDGYGEMPIGASCSAPANSSEQSGDCDDQRSDIHPGAAEADCADPTDYNCDGSVAYADADADGFAACNDCNDADATVSPAAVESCNSRDDNCDGDIDEGLDLPWYLDDDGDGYGDVASLVAACAAPVGTVADATDCDDADPARNPGMVELCDAANTDEDCDGLADDTDPGVSGRTSWYVDSDGDGYGSSAPVSACEAPAGAVSSSSDCNDASASISPGATEVCGDSVDQDCSGADRACPGWSGSESADANYDHKIYGIGLQAAFGVGLAGGDFDGDGVGDLLVGDSGYNYSGAAAGAVFGYYGPIFSGAWVASAHDDLLDYNTSSSYDGIYGGQIANLGDVSADGSEDYLVLANNSTSLSYRGGHSGLSTYGYYMRSLPCTSGGAIGDWDGGTNQDYFCADSSYSSSRGIVYLYSGTSTSSSGSYTGENSSDYAGAAAAAGDFDGDGLDDLVVGAYGNDSGGAEAGAVYLILSPGTYGSRLLSTADAKITGAAASDNLGRTVKVFSDRDGDGYADLLVGASGQDTAASNAGALYLVTNPSSGSISTVAWGMLTGEVASDNLGTAAVTIGDWDGDGVEDVVAGARNSDRNGSNTGAAFLFYDPGAGTRNAAAAGMIWNGVNASDYFGYTAATIPNIDGDGNDELALSALNGGHSTVAIATGAVWLWMGR